MIIKRERECHTITEPVLCACDDYGNEREGRESAGECENEIILNFIISERKQKKESDHFME